MTKKQETPRARFAPFYRRTKTDTETIVRTDTAIVKRYRRSNPPQQAPTNDTTQHRNLNTVRNEIVKYVYDVDEKSDEK